jgi:4-carboxymuconolactone decarboxylase
MNKPRIPTKPKDELDGITRDAFDTFLDPERWPNVFATLAQHPALCQGWIPFARHVLSTSSSTISIRDREIVILRIGFLCQAEYEWAQHVRLARKEGFSEQEIEQIKAGPDADGVSEQDALLLRATDQLHQKAKISDDVWQALTAYYNTQQMMDIVFAVGNYNLVSMALNSFGVQLDEGLKGDFQ